jgi:autotransporter-associated beta strand protein
VIHAGKCGRVDINVPVNLREDLMVTTAPDKDPNCFLSFNGIISGPHALILNSSGDPNVAGINFHDVHFGILQLNNSNTYSGGTLINGGKINVRKEDGLGTGTVTLDHFGTLSTESTIANPLVIQNGTLFHCSLGGSIKLNGTANLIGNCTISGGMSGAGGFILHGTNGTYLNMVPGGTVTLEGTNTYTGPTTVFPGTLVVKKAAGLYNGDSAKWTPANITIHKAATLRLHVGGPGEFSGEQLGKLLGNLCTAVHENGLMDGSFLSLDTASASAPVIVSANITDSKGPGGGSFRFTKCGAGVMKLAGNNTYTGRTVLENGTLSVSSLNSYTKGKGKPSSSLGAPMDIEAGEIVVGDEGKDRDCALVYTGSGETSDRVINLAGKNATVTFDQSGTGLFKLTSALLISGYGADKTVVLKGDTAGTGEIAGAIIDPHDRAGKAATSVVKSGSGTWTLSGANTHSGPTRVTQGTLSLSNAQSLGDSMEIDISAGAMLELNFKGEARVEKLLFDGKPQPAGRYDARSSPKFIQGTGVLTNG